MFSLRVAGAADGLVGGSSDLRAVADGQLAGIEPERGHRSAEAGGQCCPVAPIANSCGEPIRRDVARTNAGCECRCVPAHEVGGQVRACLTVSSGPPAALVSGLGIRRERQPTSATPDPRDRMRCCTLLQPTADDAGAVRHVSARTHGARPRQPAALPDGGPDRARRRRPRAHLRRPARAAEPRVRGPRTSAQRCTG